MTDWKNKTLSLFVKDTLRDYLGRYSDGTNAFWPTESSSALVAEGLPGGITVTGLEVIFALYPLDASARAEFGVGSDPDVLHHMLVAKAWQGSVFPARMALEAAFPLMSTNLKQRERFTPATDLGDGVSTVEQLVLMLPVERT